MRNANYLFTALIFALLWVALSLLRPQLTDPYEWKWYIACLIGGGIAATTGIFAYRWWNKL